MQVQSYQEVNGRITLLSTFALLVLVAFITLKLMQQFLQQDISIKPFANELISQKIVIQY
ncbi:hypothetical protein [Abyssogena phaseoliformis symbiont]|uniref:hypothetical protein n=1 Tax=Abyssogena phaseoliformis symbiont TaxID=596095 RepID=UPI001CEE05E4|nr:hypothetical protein [Abyssogena phaseoliformis symbiont]MBW5289165.1 hypothetical protein [Candidatus Ruthia sp. Apha_13_S6]